MVRRVIPLLAMLGAWGLCAWLATHHEPGAAVLGRWSVGYAALLGGAALGALLLTFAWRGSERARRILVRSAAVGLPILLLLGLVEGALQWFDPIGLSTYEETRRYLVRMEPDPDTIYRHPRSQQARFQGVDVATNELGMRDGPLASAHEHRLLVLGDSVTFGWGVAAEHTFCRRLEALTGGSTRVLNSGVGGWNTIQQRAFLRAHGDELAPDAVVLVYVHNDVAEQGEFDPWSGDSFAGKSPPQTLHMLLRWSQLYTLVRHVATLASEPPEVATREDPGWGASMRAVADIAAWCAAREAPFAVVLYRREDSPKYTALVEDLAPIAREAGAAWIDTRPWFEGHGPDEVCNSPCDAHPNARGHEIVATGLFAALQEAGLLRP